jgi:hypothetical protein
MAITFGEGKDNTTNELLTKLYIDSAKWKLSGAKDVNEARCFYLSLEDGATLIFQVAYTNVASEWFQVNAHYIPPPEKKETSNKEEKEKHEVNIRKNWIDHSDNVNKFWVKLSKDRLGVEIGSNFLKIDPDTGNISIKLKCSKMHFELSLADEIGLMTVSDGCIKFQDEGNIRLSFLPNLKGQGKFKLKGQEEKEIKVRGFCILQWQGLKLQRCASRCNLGWFQSETTQAISLKYLGTKKQDFESAGMSIAVQDNQVKIASKDPELDIIDGSDTAHRTGKMKISGKDKEEREITMETKADEMYQVTKIKVLDKVPFVMRKIIQTLVANPVIFHYKATDAKEFINEEEGETGRFMFEESIIDKGKDDK